MNRKWWLGLVALLCLTSTTFAVKDDGRRKCQPNRPHDCATQVPEGGNSLIYVLGAGVTCLGAMLIRFRVAKPAKS